MQATSQRWPHLRLALLVFAFAALCVGICVVEAARSHDSGSISLLGFPKLWEGDDADAYNGDDQEDPVVRDSVIGHAQRQLNILRGHLNRYFPGSALVYVILTLCLAAYAVPDLSRAPNTSTSVFS